MLFNSYFFILIFLPIVVTGYYFLYFKKSYELAISWLVIASLVFYGWWKPAYLVLLICSILFNYALGVVLQKNTQFFSKKLLLVVGISINLLALAYFKYAFFVLENVNLILDSRYHLERIILPLAISFFTFQQIAYLVDAYKCEAKEYNFLHYSLFVTFFPQLIAGPIVHHKEMMPQFGQAHDLSENIKNISLGLSIFSIGLFKKVMIADSLSVYATRAFTAAQTIDLTFFEAWTGVLAYSFQIYFDFSAYSEMAIGIALLFGIRLPINFYSPYKSVSIIDFWRTWHISLSRFLRDYLYIPLGGNKKGKTRRYVNLLLTMLLGGFWHGAGWTFVIWGGLHGLYLIVNHAWRNLKTVFGINDSTVFSSKLLSRTLTFVAVSIAWVFFRADDAGTAYNMVQSLFGFNGISLPVDYLENMGQFGQWLSNTGVRFEDSRLFHGVKDIIIIILILMFVWYAPNTFNIMSRYQVVLAGSINIEKSSLNWSPNVKWSVCIAAMLLIAILNLATVSEFIYFQF